ncbi:NUDIX domain-containing protein [Planctomycetota bacterium]|nr:NUDIX domain-containing protein [Planctomycetota bacterium]
MEAPANQSETSTGSSLPKSVTTGRPTYNGRVHGVVVACYRPSDKKWLMIRRSEHVPAPLMICFPGGAREEGEALDIAALREMKEEVGADVTLLEQVWYYELDDKPLTLYGFLAKLDDDFSTLTHDPAEVKEILWLTTEEALAHPDAIGNSRFFLKELTASLPKHGL